MTRHSLACIGDENVASIFQRLTLRNSLSPVLSPVSKHSQLAQLVYPKSPSKGDFRGAFSGGGIAATDERPIIQEDSGEGDTSYPLR